MDTVTPRKKPTRNVGLLLAIILVGLGSQGCFVRGYGGYSLSPERQAAQVSLHADMLMWGLSARARVGETIQEAAIAIEGGVSVPEDKQFFYAYVGVNVFQGGAIDGEFRWGSGSPWAHVGWGWCDGSPSSQQTGTCYTVGLDAEASVRFAPLELEPFLGISVGMNWWNVPTFR
jgi:hypothetical protein